jgi:hypothetical protein
MIFYRSMDRSLTDFLGSKICKIRTKLFPLSSPDESLPQASNRTPWGQGACKSANGGGYIDG